MPLMIRDMRFLDFICIIGIHMMKLARIYLVFIDPQLCFLLISVLAYFLSYLNDNLEEMS